MKPYIFLLIFCFSFLHSYSQSNEPFGHFYDADQNLLIDYLDKDYEPLAHVNDYYNNTSVYYSASTTLVSDFFNLRDAIRSGYYYDKSGKRIEKKIYGNDFSGSFKYEDSEGSSKSVVSARECLALVVEKDSFVVMNNFEINTKMGKTTIGESKFVRVIDHIPNYTFYCFVNSHSNAKVNYFYQARDDEKPIAFPANKKKFQKFCETYFSDFPLILKQIGEKKIEEYDVVEVIKIIDYTIRYRDKSKIYYDKYWNELKNEDEHEYYALVDKIENGTWHLSYFDSQDRLLYKGSYSSLQDMKKDGVFEWYYPNGAVRKKAKFSEGVISDKVINYGNGTLHYIMKYVRGENEIEGWKYIVINDIDGKSLLDNDGNGTEEY